MATLNPFDLLGDDDNEDPSQLIAAAPQLKVEKPKKGLAPAPAQPAKLPSKPAPPAEAVREAKNEVGRGGGRGGGRGFGRGRGGGGFNRDSRSNDNSFGNSNGFSGGYRPSEEGDAGKSSERRGSIVPRGPYRGGRRGSFGNENDGEGERPRRIYERRSGTGRGNEVKRDGAALCWSEPVANHSPPYSFQPQMADSEKLMALKKAYADIILNTAKEAAARIMVSERKALRYQQELFAAKDEALHMLLRLKKMLDAKVNESEVTSLSQQRRIEELEAQLGEAEDIVRDLRAELSELQEELDKVTNDRTQLLHEQIPKNDMAIQATTLDDNRPSASGSVSSSLPEAQPGLVSTSDMKHITSNGTYEEKKCCSEYGSHKDNCFAFNSDFASIVMRNKEPELYRNGCTQRIRAFERILLDENLSVSGQVDCEKNEKSIVEDKEHKNFSIEYAPEAANVCGGEEDPDERKVVQAGSNRIQIVALNSFNRKRKRRYRRTKVSLMKSLASEAANVCGGEEDPDETEVVQAGSNCIQVVAVNSFHITRKGRKRRTKVSAFRKSPDHVLKLSKASDLSCLETFQFVDGNFQSKEYSRETEDKNQKDLDSPLGLKLPSDEDQKDLDSPLGLKLPSDITDMLSQSEFAEVPISDTEFLKACTVRNITNKDQLLKGDSQLMRQESESADISEVPACKRDLEMVNVTLENSYVKASDQTDGLSTQPTDNKFLKYTFQRKRKKESFSNPDRDSYIDKSTSKIKLEENDSLELQASSLIAESSRGNRRLAQVARQLISLSEKTWR